MKTIFLFIENTGINWSVIWVDCAPYLCLLLIIALVLVIIQAKKTAKELQADYLIRSTYKLCALNGEIMELQTENTSLLVRLQKSERKRDEKGHYLPTSGKGHGKKKQTV